MSEVTDAQHRGLDLCLQRLTSSLYGLMDAALVNEDGHLASLTVDTFLMEAHIISIINSCRWLLSLAADLDANRVLHAPNSKKKGDSQRNMEKIRLLQQQLEQDRKDGLLPFPSIVQQYSVIGSKLALYPPGILAEVNRRRTATAWYAFRTPHEHWMPWVSITGTSDCNKDDALFSRSGDRTCIRKVYKEAVAVY
ncbi:uncharacterized protein LOC34620290 [Cyclospora cayetanensis]|uniref:Uncharacterized protein LOC34620290 n=1 Tax=Cyclospora cayetanensis TaxID=88456 RepID=A0A6P6S576_9EIME|nr:uncharacterized protein LOC34620290 [Cyclospora cayetanensis]